MAGTPAEDCLVSQNVDVSAGAAAKTAKVLKKKTAMNIAKHKKGFVPPPPSAARPKDLKATEKSFEEMAKQMAENALASEPLRKRTAMMPEMIEKMKVQLRANKFKGSIDDGSNQNNQLATLSGMPAALTRQDLHKDAAKYAVTAMNIPAGMTVVELEFNDYPEIARRRMSDKQARQGIEDRTGARIQIKGIYTPKGQAPPVE